MVTVQSVTGPLDTDEMGFVLMHEHVLVRDHNVVVNYPHLIDRAREIEDAVARLQGLVDRGISTIVDLTTVDLGRDIEFIREVVGRAEINVIVATGIWTNPPVFFAVRPIETLIDSFVRDIQQGIAGTPARAGIIKLALDAGGMMPLFEMTHRAGARAHRLTGVPISTHTDALSHGGDAQQAIFAEEGVDLARTVIGHSGDTTDIDYLKRLMERGSTIGMDRFGLEHNGPQRLASFAERVEVVAQLCKAGYTDRMVLSHDASCCKELVPDDSPLLSANPDWNMFFISDSVIPALLDAGVTAGQVETMCVENPRRMFSQHGPY